MISDATVQKIAQVLTDPTHPFNQLKRPAKRCCHMCGKIFISKVSILCEDGVCSQQCRNAAHNKTQVLLAIMRGEMSRIRGE